MSRLDDFVSTFVNIDSEQVRQQYGGIEGVDPDIAGKAHVSSLRGNMEYEGSLHHVSLEQNGEEFDLNVRGSSGDIDTAIAVFSDIARTHPDMGQPEIVLKDDEEFPHYVSQSNSLQMLEDEQENNISDNTWPNRDLEGRRVYRVEDVETATDLYRDYSDITKNMAIPGLGDGPLLDIVDYKTRTDYPVRISATTDAQKTEDIARVASRHLE